MKLLHTMRRFFCLSLIGLHFAVQAELPPDVYDEMKRNAPEVFLVRIEEAAKNKIVVRGKRQLFAYEAKVLHVFRTKSRIRPGGSIVIQSQHHIFGPGEVGPSNPRKLKEKDIVLTYLVKGGKVDEFRTAAGGYSFEEPTPQRVTGLIKVPANPVRVEPVPAPPIPVEPVPVPPIQTEPVEPAPPPRPIRPIGGPFGGLPIDGGGIDMGMIEEMPGRYEIIPVQLTQAGKPVPVVLKLDTQTGEVWRLKLTSSSFLLNGRKQVRTRLSFEPVMGAHNARHDHEDRTMPGRPNNDIDEPDVDEGNAVSVPERPKLRPRPIPIRPLRAVPEQRNLIEPVPRRDR